VAHNHEVPGSSPGPATILCRMEVIRTALAVLLLS